jgi:ferric-dicitrate binding protein FerR (iron transport regulator)
MIENQDILKFLSGEADEQLQQQVMDWAAEDPANQAELDMLQTIWLESEELKTWQEFDVSDAWSKIDGKLEEEAASPKIRRFNGWHYWAAAASIALLIMAGFYFLHRVEPELYVDVRTGENEWKEITLEDGSIITLRPNSYLRYPRTFEGLEERQIHIEGDAIVKVENDSTRGFLTQNYGAGVSVLGTTYKLDSDSTLSELENIEGQMRLFELADASNGVDLLNPGDKASFDGDSISFTPFEILPPDTPGVNIKIIDLIEFLSDRYDFGESSTATLEFSPYLIMDEEAEVKVLLEQGLPGILSQLDSTATIDYSVSGNKFYLRLLKRRE